MKFLKRFNEELSPDTYRRAGHKLRNIGGKTALKKSADLMSWSDEMARKQGVEKLSKFGKIKCSLKGELLDFYYQIQFDGFAFSDMFGYERDKGVDDFSSSLPFMVYLLPATDEVMKKCEKEVLEDYIQNGSFIQAFYINIDFSVSSGVVEFTEFEFQRNEDIVDISLTSNAATKVLNTMVKLFTDRDFGYISSDNRYDTEYEHINIVLLGDNSMSSDFGFELSDVSDFIKTVDKRKLM